MVDLGDTELTLGLPGGGGRHRERAAPTPEVAVSGGLKRGFVGTTGDQSKNVDFDFLSSNGKSSIDVVDDDRLLEVLTEANSQSPAKKSQIIGWPPVRSFRNKVFGDGHNCKYVKVAVDGVPYLRKVNLETFNSYQHLFKALKDMFSCFNIHAGCCDHGKNNYKLQVKGMADYVQTYEDKDGDLMLVGDVPWKMFTETCNRIRLMKSSEAVGLAPRTTHRDE